MSLSVAELSVIQQAGLALHRASQTLSDALRVRAQSMLSQVSSHPLHADSEIAFTHFRRVAGLSEELASMEIRLKTVYASAVELRKIDKALPVAPKQVNPANFNGKSVKSVKGPKVPKSPKSPRSAVEVRPGHAAPASSRSLSPNDLKVLTYLRMMLKSDQWTPLTGAIAAAGSGLPKGSVGVSLTRLVAAGAVRRDGGNYQLGVH